MRDTKTDLSVYKHLRTATRVLATIMSSSGPADFCRQVVHGDFVPPSTRGCQLFYLDSKSTFRSVSGYGLISSHDTNLSAWDNSPLSEAIRAKKITTGSVLAGDYELTVIAVPLIANGVPSGLIALYIEDREIRIEISQEMMEFFFRLGALYLESLDFGKIASVNGSLDFRPEDLTSRQLTILGHIDDGLVNLEIARILMLSESTIRQETVRIYKSLGVANRQEAVKKARALGILAKKPLPPRELGDAGLDMKNFAPNK